MKLYNYPLMATLDIFCQQEVKLIFPVLHNWRVLLCQVLKSNNNLTSIDFGTVPSVGILYTPDPVLSSFMADHRVCN